MQSVSFSREIAAPEDPVREAILDLESFMLGADFEEVTVTNATFADGRATGGHIDIANSVGFLQIELSLAVIDRPGIVLAYEQRDGIFETMTTEYRLAEGSNGTTVSVETEFALDASFVGPIFDATVIKRQRRREIENQFEYIQEVCE
ncbi:MAG: SRPBCC family protein [Halobacteriales archaeon]